MNTLLFLVPSNARLLFELAIIITESILTQQKLTVRNCDIFESILKHQLSTVIRPLKTT